MFPAVRRTADGRALSGGNPLDGTNANHEFKKILARAGLPGTYRVHDLRHSAATYLLAARVDPRIVMQLMGWSQRSMLTRYQHVMDSMLTDAAEWLETFCKANIGV